MPGRPPAGLGDLPPGDGRRLGLRRIDLLGDDGGVQEPSRGRGPDEDEEAMARLRAGPSHGHGADSGQAAKP